MCMPIERQSYDPGCVWDIQHVTNTQKLTTWWPVHTMVLAIREMQSKVAMWNHIELYWQMFNPVKDLKSCQNLKKPRIKVRVNFVIPVLVSHWSMQGSVAHLLFATMLFSSAVSPVDHTHEFSILSKAR